jgi:hypothetical protein
MGRALEPVLDECPAEVQGEHDGVCVLACPRCRES